MQIVIDTIMGPKSIIAPDGWVFDKTAGLAWAALLTETRKKEFKLKRDLFIADAKIEVLSVLLSTSLGMASTYWVLEARAIVKENP